MPDDLRRVDQQLPGELIHADLRQRSLELPGIITLQLVTAELGIGSSVLVNGVSGRSEWRATEVVVSDHPRRNQNGAAGQDAQAEGSPALAEVQDEKADHRNQQPDKRVAR